MYGSVDYPKLNAAVMTSATGGPAAAMARITMMGTKQRTALQTRDHARAAQLCS